MWTAIVELDDEIKNFINEVKEINESFEEIQELIFTEQMNQKNCSAIDIIKITIEFQKIKKNSFNKILTKKELNFPEGLVYERLYAKYKGQLNYTVNEHIEYIRKECSSNRREKRKNKQKLKKIYENFYKLILRNKNSSIK